MITIGDALALAGLVIASSGAIWYRLGKLEQAIKDLPCRGQADCPLDDDPPRERSAPYV